ncbi:MAG TPA: family 20 glycosylhydrolase [Opitutaceae bacterium]|jgi:hexosaminidase|nr:family 20 glycosylhydrolase [Opitutaceae bacterium]
MSRCERLTAAWSAVFLALAVAMHLAAAESVPADLMPVPAEVHFAAGRLPVTAKFAFAITGHDDARLRAALARALQRWEARTGLVLAHEAGSAAEATLIVECGGPGGVVPSLDENEAYALEIDSNRATLHAATVVGALRGLETLLQLLQADADGYFLPVVSIRDQPRFPWRGLLIDVSRHWQPLAVIKRNLDGMALVKLNVLHLHLTDNQGFRIESKTHPELVEKGSDGNYFTQDQMRGLIAYAAARGIRVVPEFDLPGHTTSWVVSHPELASQPGPYQIERHWGVFDPVLDPTNEKTYALLDDFLGEMAALFPDAYIHIGGDENDGVQWNANARIQAFIREHQLHDNAGLQTYFNQRVSAILARHGKRMIGWDEIFQPGLPDGSVIQSWRGIDSLAAAARQGYGGILSNGYYIDLMHPAAEHYLNDPVPAGTTLTPAEQKRILGGEATMWSEWVTPETIDSRIWPRTAAIAERLWSPRAINDVADMYRRLAGISARLDEAGLLHERNHQPMLRRLAGDNVDEAGLLALETLTDLVEPVKNYERGQQQPDSTQFTPLTGLVDCAQADSAEARAFSSKVDRLLSTPSRIEPGLAAALQHKLEAWAAAGHLVATVLPGRAPCLREAAPLGQALEDSSRAGLEALSALLSGQPQTGAWRTAQLAVIARAAAPQAATELAVLAPISRLVTAAAVSTQP